MDNIVIFGPAHSGKTTLCGYFEVYNLSKEERNRRRLSIIKHFHNPVKKQYLDENKFAMFWDTNRDETRDINDNVQSTTKQIKIRKIKLDALDREIELSVVDTPGAQNIIKERFRGIYMGDIGIYVFEMSKLYKMFADTENNVFSHFVDWFSSLMLWQQSKGVENLIIAVSKIDEIPYEEQETVFNSAKEYFSLILDLNVEYINIVPIFIDFDAEQDHNIIDRKNNVPWYKGVTLCELLLNIMDKSNNVNLQKRNLLMFANKEFRHVPSIGSTYRYKIFQGEISVDDKVKICPVKYGCSYAAVTADIRSMHLANSKTNVNCANTNDIISIKYKNNIHLLPSNKSIGMEDIQISKNAIVTQEDEPILHGNLLSFTIEKDKTIILSKVNFNQEVDVIWYGRKITGNIVAIDNKNNHSKIYILMHKEVALPKSYFEAQQDIFAVCIRDYNIYLYLKIKELSVAEHIEIDVVENEDSHQLTALGFYKKRTIENIVTWYRTINAEQAKIIKNSFDIFHRGYNSRIQSYPPDCW